MGKASAEEKLKVAKDITKRLLKEMGVEADVKTSEVDEAVNIDVEGDDLGLLIGHHGETLESLQVIVGLLVNKKLGLDEWVQVSLDVGGWRDERQEALKAIVQKAAAEISADKDSVELSPMPPSQRRMVHLILGDFPELTSESVGEEPSRKVVIKRA